MSGAKGEENEGGLIATRPSLLGHCHNLSSRHTTCVSGTAIFSREDSKRRGKADDNTMKRK